MKNGYLVFGLLQVGSRFGFGLGLVVLGLRLGIKMGQVLGPKLGYQVWAFSY